MSSYGEPKTFIRKKDKEEKREQKNTREMTDLSRQSSADSVGWSSNGDNDWDDADESMWDESGVPLSSDGGMSIIGADKATQARVTRDIAELKLCSDFIILPPVSIIYNDMNVYNR
jgi:hypothetical protein